MPRQARQELPDGIFHVTVRGVDGAWIVRDDHDRAAWCRYLGRTVRRFAWTLRPWCLMNTHFHLIVETTQPSLSRGMHWLNFKHAQRFNNRYDRHGHLFENRFSSRVIEGAEHFENACQYVLMNPVKAGLCDRIEDWPWSGTGWPGGHGQVRNGRD